MRRIILFVAVLFMTVPAMAVSDVNITCTVDGDEVTVDYNSSENLIRAFGLDITVDTGNITDVCVVDANYRIYPGQIVIVDGAVTDYNTPYAPDDLGDANVTIEMGSLYTWDTNYISDANAGYGMEPGTSGTLLKFYVDASCHFTITENLVVGGIVMEDPEEEPTVTDPLCEGDVDLGCACLGEVSGDNKVSSADLVVISGLIGSYGSGKPKAVPSTSAYYVLCGDANGDDKISSADLVVISGWIGSYGSGKPKSIACPHSYTP